MPFQLGLEFHTFTMIGRCEREGLLGICLTSSPPAVAARCVYLRANVGAVATQAYTDPGLGSLALRLLGLGYSPAKVIDEMKASDEWSGYRQHGVLDQNGRTAVFTGSNNLDWKGHVTGPNHIAMGNSLAGPQVVDAMAKAFLNSSEEILEERLLRAIEAGRNAGGERGSEKGGPPLSSGLVVYGRNAYPRTDLRVDLFPSQPGMAGDAVDELRRVFSEYKPLIEYYELRPRDPLMEGWRDWQAKHRC